MRTTLLAAASALVLSAGIASAAPAITQSSVNMRAGPGTQYPVVTSLPARVAVDVAGCSGSWCQVSWNGADGYVSANYLQMAGGPGAVVASPDYYDDEPDYGTSVYVTPGYYGPSYGYRQHRQWNDRGNWRQGNDWNRPGRPDRPVIGRPGSPGDPGFAGPPAAWRNNPGIGAPRVNAPTGLRTGGPGFAGPPAAWRGNPGVGAPSVGAPAAPSAPAASPGGPGFGTPLAR